MYICSHLNFYNLRTGVHTVQKRKKSRLFITNECADEKGTVVIRKLFRPTEFIQTSKVFFCC